MISPRPEVRRTPIAPHGGRLAAVAGDHATPAVVLDFSVCLNAFGPAPAVQEAVRRSAIADYPDPCSLAPREAAARAWSRPIDEVAFGAGAAELIHAVCFAYVRRNDDVLIATPAFGEYERAASLCGARVRLAPAPADGDTVRLTTIIADTRRIQPRLVFVAAPASPGGALVSHHDLRRLADACESAGSLLVLDQAYDAFCRTPLGTPALPGHPAVLHLRSLTKEQALAGVRVAFAVAPADVIGALERVRVPWAASALAQVAGTAAFGADAQTHVARTIPVLRAEAARLAAECNRLGFATRPSGTHFFLVDVTAAGSAAVARAMLLQRSGILVRDCASFGLPSCIRVAARQPNENDALLHALGSLRAALPQLPAHPHRSPSPSLS